MKTFVSQSETKLTCYRDYCCDQKWKKLTSKLLSSKIKTFKMKKLNRNIELLLALFTVLFQSFEGKTEELWIKKIIINLHFQFQLKVFTQKFCQKIRFNLFFSSSEYKIKNVLQKKFWFSSQFKFQGLFATRIFNICLLHAVAFSKKLLWLAQTNVIT